MNLENFGVIQNKKNVKKIDSELNVKTKYKIYNGDCEKVLEKMAFEDERVDLVVTSPPYYIMRGTMDYGTYESYMEKMKRVFDNLRKVLRPGRIVVVNIGDYLIDGKRLFLGADFIKMLQELKYNVFDDIIWAKPIGYSNAAGKRAGMFIKTRLPMYYKPNNRYEHMILAINGSEMARFNEKYYGKDIYESSKVSDTVFSVYLKKYMTDIWEFAPKNSTWHPAPFPLDMPYKFILLYSFVGETILDIFHGSGTTMIAASMLNRSAIGIEMNKDYINRFIKEFDKDVEVV